MTTPLTPDFVWTTPLKQPVNAPGYLLGTVEVLGVQMHVEAWRVRRNEAGRVVCDCPADDLVEDGAEQLMHRCTDLERVLEMVDGDPLTMTLGGEEYVVAVTPCRA